MLDIEDVLNISKLTDDEKKLIDSQGLSINLSKEEIAFLDNIIAMEVVHNILAENLVGFKNSIMENRNKVVKYLGAKYKINNPRSMTYDKTTKKLVSIYHPSVRGVKIISSSDAFQKIASDMLQELVKQLKTAYSATEE